MSYAMQLELMSTYHGIYNHDQHQRDYYDQAVGTLGKFEGERYGLAVAYNLSCEGFEDDSFGSVQDIGYFSRVTFDEAPFIVCFVEDSQGFVTEISNREFEDAEHDYIEMCEAEECDAY